MEITDKELEDIGVSRKLWGEWYGTMSSIYKEGKKIFSERITQAENEISIDLDTCKWKISGYFVNNNYIEVTACLDGIEMVRIRCDQRIDTKWITNSLFVIIVSSWLNANPSDLAG